MRPFVTPEARYLHSVALDASTVGSVTVAISCSSSRRGELDVLNSVFENGGQERLEPFTMKGRALDRRTDAEFFEALLEANRTRLGGVHHVHRADADTHRIEAVLSAVLVNELLETTGAEPLVLLDGDAEKVRSFARAISGLRTTTPPVAHCIRAETYYPHSLLADLTAHYLAGCIEDGDHDSSSPGIRVRSAARAHEDEWGKAYSSVVTSKRGGEPVEVPTCFGVRARERVRCWFRGAMARRPDPEHRPDASIRPVTRFLRKQNYERLSRRIDAL